MTSKEALKKVKNIGKEVNPSMYQVKELSRCCGVIKKDLEVLEILKKHLLCLSNCEDEKPNEHIEACSGEGIDRWGYNKFSDWNINCVSDFRIVKEWLERKELIK